VKSVWHVGVIRIGGKERALEVSCRKSQYRVREDEVVADDPEGN